MRRGVAAWGLGRRLFAAQAVALGAGAGTAILVAAVIGPPLFRAHLLESGHVPNSPQMMHIEQAFTDAGLVALALGAVVALAAALAVTWFVVQRLRAPLDELTAAATRMGYGDYRARVAAVGAGPELATLGATFNAMAERLDGIEDTRRRLLSDVAHEMRTPLATISVHLEAVSDGVTTWEDARPVIESQAQRLTRLARDLDEVSRMEEGSVRLDLAEHNLSTLLRDTVAQLAPRFEEKGVTLTVAPADATVRVDAQRIGQLVSNLLTNALRHTPPGGRVLVGAEVHDGVVTVSVTDSGEGITDEQLPHVFERFYRGDTARDRDRGGAGIGLAIARALAEAHGGSLTASSDGAGHGSTFVLTLPAAGRR